jgi:cardiolipin synthase
MFQHPTVNRNLHGPQLIRGRSEPPKKKPILARIPLASSHENIYTVPNILTFSRLLAAPLVGYLLVHNYHTAALSLFAYAGITDLVDGYIARRYSLQTVVGTIIDPMADKLLMTIGVACLAVNGSLPGKSRIRGLYGHAQFLC